MMSFTTMLKMSQIFTLPEKLPPIFMAADGPIAASTAGNNGDGLIVVGGKKELKDIFVESGGKNKPCFTEIALSWAETSEKAVELVYEYWPLMAIKTGSLDWDIATHTEFEELAKNAKKEEIPERILCSSDPQAHIDKIKENINAGFDLICIQQIGNNQTEFIEFYKEEILPEFK